MNSGTFRVLLVDQNPDDVWATRNMLATAHASSFHVAVADSLMRALNLLMGQSFDVALVDLALPDSSGLDALDAIRRYAPDMPVVLQTALAGEYLAVKAVERGAQDYLVKSALTSEALIRVLTYSIARGRNAAKPPDQEQLKALLIGLAGAKGGVGTTTIACRHALELASAGKKVLVMDLDLSGASAAFLFKSDSEHSMADASTNLHRLDADLWGRLVFKHASGIELLSPPGAQSLGQELDHERVRHVIRFARSRYDYIVLDMGRLNALALELIEDVQELYLITTSDLPALFEVGRILKHLVGAGSPREKVRLVFNRLGKSFSQRDVERALGYEAFAAIGEHGAVLAEAFGEGQYLEPNLPLQREIAQFTAKTLGLKKPNSSQRIGRGFLRLARA